MIEYVQEILIPYVTEKQKELTFASDYPALALFGTFKSQCMDEVYDLVDIILCVCIPANCTDKLQLLDLSINKPAKDFMRKKFQEWYGNNWSEPERAPHWSVVDVYVGASRA